MQKPMLSVEEARAIILRSIKLLSAEKRALNNVHSCVLAEDVVAPTSLQPFDNSAVDGYAVRAADIASAAGAKPVRLRVIEEIAAGYAPKKSVRAVQAARIFTGAPVPCGADTVVMQEDTTLDGNAVTIHSNEKRGANIRRAGEDVRAGQKVLRCGQVLGAGHLGLLASLGIEKVQIGPTPRVGILVTGDELVPLGRRLRQGQIYDSNSVMLSALLRRCGGEPIAAGSVRDTRGALRVKICKLVYACDAIVTVGGVSVGKYDLVKPVLEELGATLKFWKVAMKPGKPFVFGHLRDVPVFGLPGNPVSAFVTFLLLVRPALLKMQGRSDLDLPTVEAVAAESFENRGDRRHFVRAIYENGRVRSSGRQGSHLLSSLAAANCLVDLPADASVAKNERVRVLRFA